MLLAMTVRTASAAASAPRTVGKVGAVHFVPLARRKARDEMIQFCSEDPPYERDRDTSAPDALLDHQTCTLPCYAETHGGPGISIDGGDAMLRVGPRHMLHQPRSWCGNRENNVSRFRSSVEADQSVLQSERLV